MDLRDELAAAALTGLMANVRTNVRLIDVNDGVRPDGPYRPLADLSYVMADAMLEAREPPAVSGDDG